MTQRHARISRANPPVPLELKTLLQAYHLNRAKASRELTTLTDYVFSQICILEHF